jgi:Mrp family chromosome partitioning ATPase
VTEILRDVTDFATAAQRVNVGGGGVLTILPSGARGPTPGRLLVVDKLRDLLGGLQEQFDHIIIDSPPINLLADAALLGAASDAVLLVVRAGHTRFEELRYAMDQLTAARAPVIGTLLNDIDPNRRADDESYRYLEAVNRYADNGEGLARLGR